MIITIVARWIFKMLWKTVGGIFYRIFYSVAWLICALLVYPFTKPAIPIRECEWTPYYVWHPRIINGKLVWNRIVWRSWAKWLSYGWDTLNDEGFVAYRLSEPVSKTYPAKITADGGGGPSSRQIRPYRCLPYPPLDNQTAGLNMEQW